jgi:hypothetical protein
MEKKDMTNEAPQERVLREVADGLAEMEKSLALNEHRHVVSNSPKGPKPYRHLKRPKR